MGLSYISFSIATATMDAQVPWILWCGVLEWGLIIASIVSAFQRHRPSLLVVRFDFISN